MKTAYIIILAFYISQGMYSQENLYTNTQQDSVNNSKKEYDTPAEYPGGMALFNSQFIRGFQKPKLDPEIKKVTIIAQFTVEVDGSLTDIKILKDPKFHIGKETVRVLQNLSRWKPASLNGKAVKSVFVLPITIQFQ